MAFPCLNYLQGSVDSHKAEDFNPGFGLQYFTSQHPASYLYVLVSNHLLDL